MANAEAGPSTTPAPAAAPTSEPAEVGPIGTFERWRRDLCQFTGLGLSEAEQEARKAEQERLGMARSWDRCERMKNDIMQTSPIVVFMLKHLELAGCPFPTDSLQCFHCPTDRGGGFAPEFGVLLCQNRIMSKRHLEDTMTHELLHAYDHCRFKVDWHNLRHQACSEIRAANLSGDCRWSREFDRHYYGFNKQHQVCVKRRAVISVESNPNCASKEQAEKVVNEVFDSCYQDTRPFDEIYK